MEITVLNRQRSRPVNTDRLAAFLRRLVRELPPPRGDQFCVGLVSDARIRALNNEFRGVDRPTDVLAFPGDGSLNPENHVYLGDIVVSVPMAERQARDAGHTLARELRLLCLHGYLHLLGYDHETDGGTMIGLQRRLSKRLLPTRASRRTT